MEECGFSFSPLPGPPVGVPPVVGPQSFTERGLSGVGSWRPDLGIDRGKGICLGPPARCPFTVPFWLGGFPYKKKGTLILTFLLEDLAVLL